MICDDLNTSSCTHAQCSGCKSIPVGEGSLQKIGATASMIGRIVYQLQLFDNNYMYTIQAAEMHTIRRN